MMRAKHSDKDNANPDDRSVLYSIQQKSTDRDIRLRWEILLGRKDYRVSPLVLQVSRDMEHDGKWWNIHMMKSDEMWWKMMDGSFCNSWHRFPHHLRTFGEWWPGWPLGSLGNWVTSISKPTHKQLLFAGRIQKQHEATRFDLCTPELLA